MIYPEFIYVLANAKYARGRAGERARTVAAVKSDKGSLVYTGVRGRRPIIPVDAAKISRRDAGRALCRALGLTYQ